MRSFRPYPIGFLLLFVVGGPLFALGIPYTKYHWDCAGACSRNTLNPAYSIDKLNTLVTTTLEQNDAFELFFPFGAAMVSIGIGIYVRDWAGRSEHFK